MNSYKLYLVQNENKRLHTLLTRNVNKRIKRRDTIITSLQEETVKLQNNLALKQTKAIEIKQKYKNQSALLRYYIQFKTKRDKHF
jgi:hypothetical protein